MAAKLIARHAECDDLQQCMVSDQAEFVIVYGRRRVGKTFLIEQFFDGKYTFKFVGGHRLSKKVQLGNFAKALQKYSKKKLLTLESWADAFDALADYLENVEGDGKKVVFFDEMPWIDNIHSDFVSSLEYFWNSWAASRDDIVFIATGSSTSWMMDKIIENQGGLHNRITTSIYLSPFTLKETEEYLRNRHCSWSRYDIMLCYMITGGVPYYLKLFNMRNSVAQNIDKLCFAPKGKLRLEFDELYNALFSNASVYLAVVKLLSEHKSGLTKNEIIAHAGMEDTKVKRVLKNLERSDFIAKRMQYGNVKRDAVYRLVDFYTLFYYRFLEHDDGLDSQWWTLHMNSASVYAWMGLTFELLCLQHHQQIKKALGIGGVATTVSTWRYLGNKAEASTGAQIDMVLDRADRIIHLCEMKFSKEKYTLTKDYLDKIQKRMWIFQEVTKPRKAVVNTFVTTYGLSNPQSSHLVHSEVTMDDLFEV